MAVVCKSCQGRGWQVDTMTRQQIPCPVCQPKKKSFGLKTSEVNGIRKETKKDKE